MISPVIRPELTKADVLESMHVFFWEESDVSNVLYSVSLLLLWGGAHRPGRQIRDFSKIRFALGTRRVGRTRKYRL